MIIYSERNNNNRFLQIYRPISFLPALNKVVKSIIAIKETEKKRTLDRTTLSLEKHAVPELSQNLTTGVLFFYVEKTFDRS